MRSHATCLIAAVLLLALVSCENEAPVGPKDVTPPISPLGGEAPVDEKPQPQAEPDRPAAKSEAPESGAEKADPRDASDSGDEDRTKQGDPAAAATNNAIPAEKIRAPGPSSWPSFRNGPLQLGIAGSDLSQELELLWSRPTEHGVSAAAAIVDDFVYVGTLDGTLLCLDRTSGEPHWTYRSVADPEEFAPGFKAAPTVTADTVYVGDEDGVVHAVDRATGAMRWTFTTDAEIAGGAAIVGDKVIVGSHDTCLYCLFAKDGTLDWKFRTEDRVNCAPAIIENFTFVAGCDAHLRVIDIEAGEQRGDIYLGDGAYLIASPAVEGDVLYVATHTSKVLAVDWRKQEIVWTFEDEKRKQPYHASAAVTADRVIVGGHDKILHCLNRQNGEEIWQFPTRAKINSSAVVVDDRVYFGSGDGNIYGVSLSDGQEIWKHNAGDDVNASPAVGEDVLVVGTEGRNGEILCFGAKQ